jgi:hypothetical protein
MGVWEIKIFEEINLRRNNARIAWVTDLFQVQKIGIDNVARAKRDPRVRFIGESSKI